MIVQFVHELEQFRQHGIDDELTKIAHHCPYCIRRILEAFFSAIATLPFDEADAQAAAAVRAALKAKGHPIGYDVLIAGTGLARGLVVITSNPGEFKRADELDWR